MLGKLRLGPAEFLLRIILYDKLFKLPFWITFVPTPNP